MSRWVFFSRFFVSPEKSSNVVVQNLIREIQKNRTNQTPHDAPLLRFHRLAMACDVVVQLDEHLCLTQDAPQLAAMFFRRPVTGIRKINDGSQGVVTGRLGGKPGWLGDDCLSNKLLYQVIERKIYDIYQFTFENAEVDLGFVTLFLFF